MSTKTSTISFSRWRILLAAGIIILAVKSKKLLNRTLNLSGSELISYSGFIRTLRQITGKTITVRKLSSREIISQKNWVGKNEARNMPQKVRHFNDCRSDDSGYHINVDDQRNEWDFKFEYQETIRIYTRKDIF